MTGRKDSTSSVRFLPLTYNNAEPQTSALRLVLTLFPEWEHSGGQIEFVRFTDGITNTLLKAIHKLPGLSDEEIDTEAVLLRAYGKGTDLLIDRDRETQNHELLGKYGLAPKLLARFHNGMLYRYIKGRVTLPADLRRESIWRGVARRLAEWHAIVPCLPGRAAAPQAESRGSEAFGLEPQSSSRRDTALQTAIDNIAPGKPAPNVWTVMQKWIYALPVETDAQKERQASLQAELTKIVDEFSTREGLGSNSLVFAHCDLLSGNVIVQPRSPGDVTPEVETVSFIDYEYATPSPAAFDLANHFAEWGGFDCDFSVLPTRSQRRGFILEYMASYTARCGLQKIGSTTEETAQFLFDEVDAFRGLPGFYWGIWALIQAHISQIDFDYAAYAEIRLGEYWAWRAEQDGSRAATGLEMPLRERRWAQEA